HRRHVGRLSRIRSTRADRPWVTVVGIVKSVRHNGLDGVIKEKFYIPHTQWHRSLGNANLIRGMTIVARTDSRPELLAAPLRDVIRRIAPRPPPPRGRDSRADRPGTAGGPPHGAEQRAVARSGRARRRPGAGSPDHEAL